MAKFFSMLGFRNMNEFTRSFTRYETIFNDGVISVCRSIIENSLFNEIEIVIHKDQANYEDEDVSKIMNHIKNKEIKKRKN